MSYTVVFLRGLLLHNDIRNFVEVQAELNQKGIQIMIVLIWCIKPDKWCSPLLPTSVSDNSKHFNCLWP